MKVNVIIPLGGKGERFAKLNYKLPKPLIKVMGTEIICWLIDSLNLDFVDTVIIPYNEVLSNFRFEDFLRSKYPGLKMEFYKLNGQTLGAADTLFRTLDNVKIENKNKVLCIDGDCFYLVDIIRKYVESGMQNGVVCFRDYSDNPIYSYVRRDGEGKVVDIKEKEKVSEFANVGIYGFESCEVLKRYCRGLMDSGVTCGGEYYLSGVVRCLLKDKEVGSLIIGSDDYVCLGTPLQVRLFCNNFPKVNAYTGKNLLKVKRICFDLDNTLVTHPRVKDDYRTVLPIEKNIKVLRYLKRLGNVIIIYTARRMKTHQGNVGRIVADVGTITMETLRKFDIPYDELVFGKPYADYYIDDLAVSAYDDLEKEVGFYESKIDPRSFNSLYEKSIQIYRKESENLDGQIYWYLNIPIIIKDMFPTLISYDSENYKWYDMEKLDAITISKLYLSESLTSVMLTHIVNSINRIHNSFTQSGGAGVNIYDNYCKKLKSRYETYDYSRFKNHEKTFKEIYEYLNDYDKSERGSLCVIHGDPVLTNILINQYGKIKFIDMRGKIGECVTIYGDRHYDWAKLYQSLIGYDEILEGGCINKEYKKGIVEQFEKFMLDNFDSVVLKDVKYITASLLFSLIPLHDNEKCLDYYGLIEKYGLLKKIEN